nr:hypothetical protein BaRGS_028304 [Batillaria attramentaria]
MDSGTVQVWLKGVLVGCGDGDDDDDDDADDDEDDDDDGDDDDEYMGCAETSPTDVLVLSDYHELTVLQCVELCRGRGDKFALLGQNPFSSVSTCKTIDSSYRPASIRTLGELELLTALYWMLKEAYTPEGFHTGASDQFKMGTFSWADGWLFDPFVWDAYNPFLNYGTQFYVYTDLESLETVLRHSARKHGGQCIFNRFVTEHSCVQFCDPTDVAENCSTLHSNFVVLENTYTIRNSSTGQTEQKTCGFADAYSYEDKTAWSCPEYRDYLVTARGHYPLYMDGISTMRTQLNPEKIWWTSWKPVDTDLTPWLQISLSDYFLVKAISMTGESGWPNGRGTGQLISSSDVQSLTARSLADCAFLCMNDVACGVYSFCANMAALPEGADNCRLHVDFLTSPVYTADSAWNSFEVDKNCN